MTATNIPMMNPEIVTGIAMMLLFVFAGTLVKKSDVLGFWTLLIAHVTFALPYVILNVIPKLKQFDMHIYKDKNHSIYGGNTRFHLYTKMSEFLFNNL